MSEKTILVIGTYDTKSDELNYISDRITSMGGKVLTMDVSVLGEPKKETHFSKHTVAEAAGKSIKEAIDSGSEHIAMNIMSDGASKLANELYLENKFHGVIILGGTMGTDLALDVCQSLPLGLPKYVVSTVSFSPIIPSESGKKKFHKPKAFALSLAPSRSSNCLGSQVHLSSFPF